MTDERREAGPTGDGGATAVVLVAVEAGDRTAPGLADEVRHALRATDAVLAKEDDGVISVLLRGLRDGEADVAVVTGRLADRFARSDRSVRIAAAVAEADEPLDLLVGRARARLDDLDAS